MKTNRSFAALSNTAASPLTSSGLTSSSSSTWARSRHASSVGSLERSASRACAVFSGWPLALTAALSCSMWRSWSRISASVLFRWDCSFFWVSSVSRIRSWKAWTQKGHSCTRLASTS